MSIMYYRDKDGSFIPLHMPQGKSAYQFAVDAGYRGTPTEFANYLANAMGAADRAEAAVDRTQQLLDEYITDVDTLIGGN